MSGLEIAGVVLGALPLVVSALEHYGKVMNMAGRYWRYKTKVRSLILQVNTEHGIFINTLEQLLTGIVKNEHMADFISEPGGDAWGAVGELLEVRLGSAYGIYLDNVKGMEASLKQMTEKLALDPDGKSPKTSRNPFKHDHIRRFKFSLNKQEYLEDLSSLRYHNQALAQLTQQSLYLELSRSKSRAQPCPNFNGIQKCARNLYDTLISGLQCVVVGCTGHGAELRLENRTLKDRTDKTLLERTTFRVMLASNSVKLMNKNEFIPAFRKEVWIRCLPDPSVSSFSATLPHSAYSGLSKGTNSNSARVPQSNATSTSRMQSTAATSTPQQIMTLCDAIGSLQKPQLNSCIGYLLDPVGRKQGIHSLDTLKNHTQRQWTSFSLHQILTKRGNVTRHPTLLDKLQIATKLSSNVLQLHNTPWLSDDWRSSDIFFLYRSGAIPPSIYEDPFVYSSISPKRGKSTPNQRTTSRVIRNQTLFALGVLLIELWYGQTLEELQSASDLNHQGTPGIAWCTATRISEEELENQAGRRYADAVRRCIRCEFGGHRSADLQSERFQQAVFEGVVVPIEKTLEHFRGII